MCSSAVPQLQDRREAELRAKREEEERKRREEKRRQQEEQKRREEEELYRRKQQCRQQQELILKLLQQAQPGGPGSISGSGTVWSGPQVSALSKQGKSLSLLELETERLLKQQAQHQRAQQQRDRVRTPPQTKKNFTWAVLLCLKSVVVS